MSAGNDLLQFKTVTTTNDYIKSSLKLLPSLVQLAFLLNAYHLRLSIILEFSFNSKLATELVFFCGHQKLITRLDATKSFFYP